MKLDYKSFISRVGTELFQTARYAGNKLIDDAVEEEKIWGMSRAVDSMLECDVSDEKIISMLQKYWDLRLSEAKAIIESAKDAKLKN